MTYVWKGDNEPTVVLDTRRPQPSVEEPEPPRWLLALVAALAILAAALCLLTYSWATRPFLDTPEQRPSPAVVQFAPAPLPAPRPLPSVLIHSRSAPAEFLR